MEIECAVQNYPWGKVGSSSSVAKLSRCDINEGLPYAELWMGTHISGPSKLLGGKSLKDSIIENSSLLAHEEKDRFGDDLSYLFKVLAVAKALSIQAHPNKKLAEHLHRIHPDLYKDPNHKPEMAIPIFGDFEALCGFRPVEQIAAFVERVPALQILVGEENALNLQKCSSDAIKDSYAALMHCSEDIVAQVSSEFLKWLKSQVKEEQDIVLGDLFLRISEDFPNDVGCFSIYFLNYIILKPGEAMFLGPNIPHAYLSGDCIECMACSDNVVRAGLTPKFKDVETLCSMLDYNSGTKEKYLLAWTKDDKYTKTCRPPVPDFAVAEVKIEDPNVSYQLLPRNASIIIIIEGTATTSDLKSLQPGATLFIPANERLRLVTQSSPFVAYQAFSNVGVNVVIDASEKGSCFSCLPQN